MPVCFITEVLIISKFPSFNVALCNGVPACNSLPGFQLISHSLVSNSSLTQDVTGYVSCRQSLIHHRPSAESHPEALVVVDGDE